MGVWGPGIDQNDYGLDLIGEVAAAGGSLAPVEKVFDALLQTPEGIELDGYHIYEALSGAKLLLEVGAMPGNVVTLDRRRGQDVPPELLEKAARVLDRILEDIDDLAGKWRQDGQVWADNVRELRSMLPGAPSPAPSF